MTGVHHGDLAAGRRPDASVRGGRLQGVDVDGNAGSAARGGLAASGKPGVMLGLHEDRQPVRDHLDLQALGNGSTRSVVVNQFRRGRRFRVTEVPPAVEPVKGLESWGVQVHLSHRPKLLPPGLQFTQRAVRTCERYRAVNQVTHLQPQSATCSSAVTRVKGATLMVVTAPVVTLTCNAPLEILAILPQAVVAAPFSVKVTLVGRVESGCSQKMPRAPSGAGNPLLCQGSQPGLRGDALLANQLGRSHELWFLDRLEAVLVLVRDFGRTPHPVGAAARDRQLLGVCVGLPALALEQCGGVEGVLAVGTGHGGRGRCSDKDGCLVNAEGRGVFAARAGSGEVENP